MEARSWSPRGGGFETDRRHRIWLGAGAWCAVLLFAWGLGRIWLSVTVADHGSRVHQLEQRIERLRVDLSIAADALEQRRAYADVASTAAQVGFGRSEHTHWVPLPQETPAQDGMLGQLASDLRRGSRLILAEALAGEQPWERARGDLR